MKTPSEIRTEIERVLDESKRTGGGGGYESGYVSALDWVLEEAGE